MKLARFTGVMLLVTTLAVFVTFNFSDPGIDSADDKEAFARQVADAAARMPGIGAAHVVQVALAALAALVGVGLYQLVRRRAPGPGLAGLLMLVLWGSFAAVQGMVAAAMVTAAQGYVEGGLAEAGSDQALALIHALGRVHFGTFLTSEAALGIAVAVFSYALAWPAGLLPRWLGWLGLVAGGLHGLVPLALLQELFFLPWFLGTVLTVVWLLITGSWLVIRASTVDVPASSTPTGSHLPTG